MVQWKRLLHRWINKIHGSVFFMKGHWPAEKETDNSVYLLAKGNKINTYSIMAHSLVNSVTAPIYSSPNLMVLGILNSNVVIHYKSRVLMQSKILSHSKCHACLYLSSHFFSALMTKLTRQHPPLSVMTLSKFRKSQAQECLNDGQMGNFHTVFAYHFMRDV